MTQTAEKPKVDRGFFASIPRIIRTGYHEVVVVNEQGEEEKVKLGAIHKWLYVCLKDLCGESGTCYRTLRTLAEETGISTGKLSTSIRDLKNAGLIHADKKRRSNNPTAKEVWHITIVDIWQANAIAHPTKRSSAEPFNKNVHVVNNNVHVTNNNGSKRSCGEQQCSRGETEEEALSNIINEEEAIEEESVPSVTTPPPCADAHTLSLSSSSEKKTSASSQKQLDHSPIASPATATEPTPAPGKKPVAIGDSAAEGRQKRQTYMQEARRYGVRALEDTVNMMLRWDEINGVCGHPKWEWLALEKIVVLAHGTIEQMKVVREKLRSKCQKITPETIWTNWWMLDSQATSSRQPRGLPPEVQKAMEESRRQEAIEHHRTAIEISQKGNFQYHRELAQKAAAEREARGIVDGEPSYAELCVKDDPEVVKDISFEEIFAA